MTNNTTIALTTVNELYQYLDSLFTQDTDSDTLFAGGYLRGFISLVATKYGDEAQVISKALIDGVSEKLTHSKSELSPQDHAIVSNFGWISKNTCTCKYCCK